MTSLQQYPLFPARESERDWMLLLLIFNRRWKNFHLTLCWNILRDPLQHGVKDSSLYPILHTPLLTPHS